MRYRRKKKTTHSTDWLALLSHLGLLSVQILTQQKTRQSDKSKVSAMEGLGNLILLRESPGLFLPGSKVGLQVRAGSQGRKVVPRSTLAVAQTLN